MNFLCRENENGTFEVYNTEIGDIYFSNVGAYKEALEKFVLPSLPVLENKSQIKVLDVCYGMGYNSKTFVDYLIKNYSDVSCNIDAIEIDKNILALGLFIFDENISDEVNLYFGSEILKASNPDENIRKISGENWIKYFLTKIEAKFNIKNQNSEVYLYQNNKILTFLHNIYYQNHSVWNNLYNFNLFSANLHEMLPNLRGRYDLIFHDAFSILKQPDMWSEEVLSHYHRLLYPGGRLLTYSNSRVLRKRLEKIGFSVEVNYSNENKQNGTIAIKT